MNAQSAIEMNQEEFMIPSPPPIKRIVQWHDIFSLEEGLRSSDLEVTLTAPHVHQFDGTVQDQESLSSECLKPSTTAYQSITSPRTTVAFDRVYYSMGEDSLEKQDKDSNITLLRSPIALPTACASVLFLLVGVVIAYQAYSSSLDDEA